MGCSCQIDISSPIKFEFCKSLNVFWMERLSIDFWLFNNPSSFQISHRPSIRRFRDFLGSPGSLKYHRDECVDPTRHLSVSAMHPRGPPGRRGAFVVPRGGEGPYGCAPRPGRPLRAAFRPRRDSHGHVLTMRLLFYNTFS